MKKIVIVKNELAIIRGAAPYVLMSLAAGFQAGTMSLYIHPVSGFILCFAVLAIGMRAQ